MEVNALSEKIVGRNRDYYRIIVDIRLDTKKKIIIITRMNDVNDSNNVIFFHLLFPFFPTYKKGAPKHAYIYKCICAIFLLRYNSLV